ncbi:hypothetical protein J6590_001950 [Homalodisca vitripennis]|nr:hypothetical protein J6590_001950 [Homalodisca vitripennis]
MYDVATGGCSRQSAPRDPHINYSLRTSQSAPARNTAFPPKNRCDVRLECRRLKYLEASVKYGTDQSPLAEWLSLFNLVERFAPVVISLNSRDSSARESGGMKIYFLARAWCGGSTITAREYCICHGYYSCAVGLGDSRQWGIPRFHVLGGRTS